MSDDQITNGWRAALALDAVNTYTRMSPYKGLPEDYFFFLDSEQETGPETDDDCLADLLCGLMHYAGSSRVSFVDSLSAAEIPADDDIGKLGQALAAGWHGERDELMASTAAYSGLRWGELTGLALGQIDRAGRVTDVSCMAGHTNVRTTLLMYVGSTAGVLDRARTATD